MAVAKVRHVRVADEVWARWGAAAAERRVSVAALLHAAMDGLLEPAGGVTASALGIPPESAALVHGRVDGGGGVEPDDPAGSEVEQGDRHDIPARSARALPRRRLARREMCEHRVPPTSFCKECDA